MPFPLLSGLMTPRITFFTPLLYCCRISSQMELGDVVPTGVDDGEASVGKAAVEEVADRAGYDTERELIREVCAYW